MGIREAHCGRAWLNAFLASAKKLIGTVRVPATQG
jgi:hypothetical protein